MKNLKDYVIYIWLPLIVFFTDTNSLHLTGVWKTNEFFHFLSKFGFQKTAQHDIAHTEGYIYGNITLTGSNTTLNSQATLAVLPEEFFLDFYRNRTFQKDGDLDLVCINMFKDIEKQAYDARCHDTGKEDFLRHVPCPKAALCIDEDNSSNVIPKSQLTFKVQDINNPRFWYTSLVACQRNATCGWQHVKEEIEMTYDLTFVNGEPHEASINVFEYQFSFEKQETPEIYLICLLTYAIILVPLQMYAMFKQTYAIMQFFTATLVVQLIGLFLDSLHLLIFSSNGIGVEALNVMGDVFNIIAQSLFMLLLLLLAKGWAISRMSVTGKPQIVSLWATYTVLIFILYIWNMTEVDVIEDIDEYQTWPGWLTLILRVIIMCWFLLELRSTMFEDSNAAKLQFFLHFGAATLVWFIYLPVVAIIAIQISHLWRYKLLLGFTYGADLLAHTFMTYMLWPRRSQQFLLLYSELDHCEELEAFNEALHVLNYSSSQSDIDGSSQTDLNTDIIRT